LETAANPESPDQLPVNSRRSFCNIPPRVLTFRYRKRLTWPAPSRTGGPTMLKLPSHSISQQRWKHTPYRVVCGSSSCCKSPSLLVQTRTSGWVKCKCSQCGKTEKLTYPSFCGLDLWIACSSCDERVSPCLCRGRYAYSCDTCKTQIMLGDLIPDSIEHPSNNRFFKTCNLHVIRSINQTA